jgi:hypothetical protein
MIAKRINRLIERILHPSLEWSRLNWRNVPSLVDPDQLLFNECNRLGFANQHACPNVVPGPRTPMHLCNYSMGVSVGGLG